MKNKGKIPSLFWHARCSFGGLGGTQYERGHSTWLEKKKLRG
jgi:hypothetical protein